MRDWAMYVFFASGFLALFLVCLGGFLGNSSVMAAGICCLVGMATPMVIYLWDGFVWWIHG